MEVETNDIQVPDNIRVACPLVQFKLRDMGAHCPGCKHFAGLSDNFPGSKIEFAARYKVLCAAEPTKRQLLVTE